MAMNRDKEIIAQLNVWLKEIKQLSKDKPTESIRHLAVYIDTEKNIKECMIDWKEDKDGKG